MPCYVPTIRQVLKTKLANAMIQKNVNAAELGRLMGVHDTEVRRVINPDHPSKVERLEHALFVLGVEVQLVFKRI